MKTEWADLKFGVDRYSVSNIGIVRSNNFKDSWGRIRTGRIIKQSVDKCGYMRVRLSYGDTKKSFRVHRLVANAFIENKENFKQVNHIDGNKTNNTVNNLEWCNNSMNQLHAIKTGLRINKFGKCSKSFKRSALVYDSNGNLIDELFGNLDMINKGYDPRNVSAVLLGKRNSYKGLKFKSKTL